MHTRSPIHFDQFKQSEKKCKKGVRAAKKYFERKIAKNGNKRPFNSYIKSKTSTKTTVGPLQDGNELISDNLKMANMLNQAFSKVFTNENLTTLPDCPSINDPYSVEDIFLDAETVKTKIKNLKISSSAGPDGISSKFLTDHQDSLSLPFAILFNRSMQSGQVPEDWKMANVTPIFKKGSKNSPENYRPISLTSIPCKLMESIIKDGVINYLLRYQLIKNTQHGFMSNKSCTTNLLVFLENLQTARRW